MGAAIPLAIAAVPVAPAVQMTTSRFVTIKLYSAISGLTEKAIRRKIERGVWLQGRHWRKTDGSIFIDTKEVEKWVETATA